MSTRALLRRNIIEAWQRTIDIDYARQRINSERSLQASMWANLSSILPDTRRLFIEPCMSVAGHARQLRYPDIVVCNTREVIGIIELKYQPRARPDWTKDLATFQWTFDHRAVVTVSNHRFRGIETDSHVYPLSRRILYVWAGVHREFDALPSPQVPAERREAFLALHAATTAGRPARIYRSSATQPRQ